MLINTNTKERVSESEFRAAHPNVSFPAALTNEVLAPLGFAQLTYSPVALASQGYKIVDDGVEQVAGVWRVKYAEVQLDEAETKALADSVRADRNRLLTESDWTQVADAPVDKAAWAQYRQALRDVTEQPGFPYNVSWPVKP